MFFFDVAPYILYHRLYRHIGSLHKIKVDIFHKTHYGSELRKNGQTPLKFFVSKTFENMFILVL